MALNNLKLRRAPHVRLGLASLYFCFSLAARATPPELPCEPPVSDPGPRIRAFISDEIAPLKAAYLRTSSFELDPISANLAAIENETDPVSKRKTLTYLVRGNTERQQRGPLESVMPIDTRNMPNYVPTLSLTWSERGATVRSTEYTHDYTVLGLAALNPNLFFSTHDLQALSTTDLAATLKSKLTPDPSVALMLENSGVPLNAPDYLMFASYLKLSVVSDEASFQKMTGEMARTLSWEQKIKLAQIIGGAAGDRYDHKRAAESSLGSSSSISPIAILSNLRTTNSLGICRDIAPAQAQLLKGLGFKNVYTIAYNAGINHAAVIAQNPDKPKEILHFNYDSLERGNLGYGEKSLTRSDDYSTRYMILSPEGKTVATLPSELGELLQEGEGGNIRRLDPFLYRPAGSIAKVTLEGKRGAIPVFVGRTSSGVDVVGLGRTTQSGDPEKNVLSLTNTAGFAYQRGQAAFYSDQKRTLDALHFNVSPTLNVNTHERKIDGGERPRFSARGTTTTALHADGAASGLSGKKGVEVGVSADATFEAGGEVEYESRDQRTKVTARAASQYGIGMNDISAQSFGRVYRNVSYAKISGEQVVLPEKILVTFDTAIGVREFGPQVFAKGGVNLPGRKLKASAGYQGALRKDAFTIAPGMERKAFVDFEKEFSNSLTLTAAYQQPVDFSTAPPSVQVGAKGSLSEIMTKKRKRPLRK